MRHLYSALYYLLLPLVLMRVLWRSRRAPAYRRRLAERFGCFTAPAGCGPVLWVHAVSVGEVAAAAPLVEALLQRCAGARLVLTTTTPTGSERVQATFGHRVFHVYCPWDLPGSVSRFLDRVRPELLVLMETELWPNLLCMARRRGCRIVLANARMSARSAGRYRRFPRFTRALLRQLEFAACQTAADTERLVGLGLPPERVHVTGSLKFDIVLEADLRRQAGALRAALQRPVLLGASTHPGEEELVLEAFESARRALPGLLCVLVPRHPERFEAVYRLCRARGFEVARRSRGEAVTPAQAVLLGDTMGELLTLAGIASLCVVGGSFVPRGGQNPLEAAAWGVPLVCGPSMFNFAEVADRLCEAGAMLRLEDPADLARCVGELLQDAPRLSAMGAAGRAVVARNRGAQQRLLELLAGLLPRGDNA